MPIRPVVWFEDSRVGILSFNSVEEGVLARGRISEQSLVTMGNLLDQEQHRSSRYSLIGLVHHHPIPVNMAAWEHTQWYERLLGRHMDQTDAMVDADRFLDWARTRRLIAILHGHKHVPRSDVHTGMSIIGCGSSVGKVGDDSVGRTHMSINIIHVDTAAARLSCRLRAERIPGAGFDAETDRTHEIVFSGPL